MCYNNVRIGAEIMNNFDFNSNKIMHVNNENVTVENNTINDPFANMNKDKNNNEKKIKKYRIALYVCISIIFILLVYSLIVTSIKSGSKSVEIESKENLENVSLELNSFIDNYHLDSLDLFGFNELVRVAINDVCSGVIGCKEVQGDAVIEYVKKVFDREVTLENILCENNDGVLYNYDEANNKFVYNSNHPSHNFYSTKPVLSKVNSIKKKNGKYILVLNKLYFNSAVSEYVTTDPLGINYVYKFSDYDKPDSKGNLVLDMTKLKTDYENNYDRLKNKGTRYQYTFSKKGLDYVLEKYDVLEENVKKY